jgi:AcrR family transcriptional regulator
MARPPKPQIREKLCDQAVDYVLSHGVGELTLRPLAKALGTNARMLIYHFGSREGLMREILARLREREDARIQSWFRRSKERHTLPEFLRWQWRRLSAPRARPAGRLILELYALALRHPREYPGVLEDPLAYWQKLTERAGVEAEAGAIEATLLLAVNRGLLLDLCATGERARVGRAMDMFARLVEDRE